MNTLEKISDFVGKFMGLIVLAFAFAALVFPKTGLWIPVSSINYLLMIVMFGMGLTLRLEDFKLVFSNPKDIIIGSLAQFIVMPSLAFLLSKIFRLDPALMAGVVLVGTCPGGTASNVITYLSKGDVALSVGMTSVNTLLAPVLTPAITYLLLKASVNVDMLPMFLSIIKIVIIPICLGFLINKFFEKFTQKFVKILPLISVIAICTIIMAIISRNSAEIFSSGRIVFLVVILHNLLGCGCGFVIGKSLRLNPAKTKALSIEIGMQNSGLASSLAATTFPTLAMATVPGAIFSVWHNISGSILASIYRRWDIKEEGE